MKKISIIVMALVFLVALTQCKKEQATPANDGKTVDITLDIKSGNGTRMDVNTATGEVTYVERRQDLCGQRRQICRHTDAQRHPLQRYHF